MATMNNTDNNITPGGSVALVNKRERKRKSNEAEGLVDSAAQVDRKRRRRRKSNTDEGFVDSGRRIKLESGNTYLMEIAKEIQHNLNIEFKVDIPYPIPKFGASSICGRRSDMEDAISIHPSFCPEVNENRSENANLHYFGVYDGHGCSHVARRCKELLHVLVKEEILNTNAGCKWEDNVKQSFIRMDKVATTPHTRMSLDGDAPCRCKLEYPYFEKVGSAVIIGILTPDRMVISNCGDCRAVLCRKSTPIPLSVDHKPDRPDELHRIQTAGGHVISVNGPRVQGVLAMSRAIGDIHLKPYVSCEPEVTIFDRTSDDEFLILASDGLWDVVSNEMACDTVKSGFKLEEGEKARDVTVGDDTYDLTCHKVSNLLTNLAVARGSGDNVSVILINLKRN